MIIANLTQNAQTAQQVIADAVARLPLRAHLRVRHARCKHAIITRPERGARPRSSASSRRIVGKYM